MRHFIKPALCGVAVALVVGAIGLPSFSVEWWIALVAGNALAAFAVRGSKK